jgi:bifunctional non-homologous end joining protein LigD
VPRDVPVAVVEIGDRRVQLTNLQKPFWPDLGLTKGDLLRYYAEVADVLLPHLRDRPMVMKRWPNGVTGTFFFMKRVPKPYPPWLRTQTVEHKSGSTIDFPLVQDLPSLLWTVNLGCIDLNPWGALADDPNRPDVVYFDLDPGPEAPFDRVREVALVIRDALATLALPNVVKTSGSRGIHVAVPITRGPVARKVWEFAQAVARELAARHPKIATADFRLATRPRDRVLIDYNRNSWGQTQASVYSVRPHPRAAVSTPVTWQEVERGFAIDDFRIDNVPSRVKKRGDLWAPLLRERGRADLGRFV